MQNNQIFKRKFQHFSFREREFLSRSFAQGLSMAEVARKLGRSASSVIRELKRTGMNPKTYRAEEAQSIADKQKRKAKKSRKMENQALKTEVFSKLSLRWSPKQIVHFLKAEYSQEMQTSPIV